MGHSLWGCKESDMAERLTLSLFTFTVGGPSNVQLGVGGKSFSLLRQRRKITPQNPANLTVRSLILCSLLSLSLSLFFFFFLQWSKKSKSNPSYRKQDSDGYKGSDLKQQSLLPPTPNICASQKTNVTGPQNTMARITKVHLFKGG